MTQRRRADFIRTLDNTGEQLIIIEAAELAIKKLSNKHGVYIELYFTMHYSEGVSIEAKCENTDIWHLAEKLIAHCMFDIGSALSFIDEI